MNKQTRWTFGVFIAVIPTAAIVENEETGNTDQIGGTICRHF